MTDRDGRRQPGILDWRRLLLALPVLVAVGIAVYLLVRDDEADAATPRAMLLETAPVGDADTGVIKGRTARDFTAATEEGASLKLSDFRGKPMVLNFWATWCTSCLAEMPDLKAVQQEFGSDRVSVLALNSGEAAEDTEDFVNWLDAPDFTIAFDPSLAVTDAYGVVGLSHTVFVDAEGIIRATHIGQMTHELMREYVEAALSSSDAQEPPFKLRLPGAVQARTSVFRVEDTDDETVRISSRRLRCDDSFCAQSAIDALGSFNGVSAVVVDQASDPPSLSVAYDPALTTARSIAEALAAEVQALGDPLYEQPIEIERE